MSDTTPVTRQKTVFVQRAGQTDTSGLQMCDMRGRGDGHQCGVFAEFKIAIPGADEVYTCGPHLDTACEQRLTEDPDASDD